MNSRHLIKNLSSIQTIDDVRQALLRINKELTDLSLVARRELRETVPELASVLEAHTHDHSELTGIGVYPHSTIDAHINDAAIHFDVPSIDHDAILNVGTYPHSQIDDHIDDAAIHFDVPSIDHDLILNVGSNSHSAIDSHIADGTLHFTKSSISHTQIQDIGTLSHDDLDLHVGSVGGVHGVGTVAGVTEAQTFQNKTLDGSCDLGGFSGAKGQLFQLTVSGEDFGTGLTAVGSFINTQNTGAVRWTVPCDCKIVHMSVNIEHNNSSDPGDWRGVVFRDADSAAALLNNCPMDNLAFVANPHTGAPNTELALSEGDLLRFWIDGPACDQIVFHLTIMFATT